MRVFVTGASGWIGSAVVPELLAAGHQVAGLARSDDSAAALTAAGADVVRGSLDDTDMLRRAAAEADGVIHLAFRHDVAFTGGFAAAARSDRAAVEAFGDALAGSDRPLVVASGTPAAPGTVTTERDGHDIDPDADLTDNPAQARGANAEFTLRLADRGVRSSVLRLPRTVHGDGDQGFVAMLIATARAKGVSGYIGDGSQRWPAVHRLDAARLARLGLEHAPAGSPLHAIGDDGVPLREIAEVIGRHLDLPTASVDPADAAEHFGWLSMIASLDQPSSATLTRELLDWRPEQPGLIEDLDKGHYFTT
ncbi:3-beta hydroxysteroid dehydrogenase [Mangrovactinospora gilvigrisea]|uniref:3-beta hydroxysteroid dehydrogenase n=1 Tax=Mangrovactinospora gilvigrisea TaxID=1428644 RepID=A0A1J7C9P2_9ACTN|nr:SDR family oxidoreductase [Mangrovactinospora gilvigrisea]OIV38236.1 3-beta hydroxysteroid dehydrogenase [Mangrovactinospora gilvigrisea]